MTENQRTQLVWNTFMPNPEAQSALQLAGFQPGVATNLDSDDLELMGLPPTAASCKCRF